MISKQQSPHPWTEKVQSPSADPSTALHCGATPWWNSAAFKRFRHSDPGPFQDQGGIQDQPTLSAIEERSRHLDGASPTRPVFCGKKDFGDLGHLPRPIFRFDCEDISEEASPGHATSAETEPGAIRIYLVRDPGTWSAEIETVYVFPTGLDTTLLARLHIQPSVEHKDVSEGLRRLDELNKTKRVQFMKPDSALQRLIDDAVAMVRLLVHREYKFGINDSGLAGCRKLSESQLIHVNLLQHIAHGESPRDLGRPSDQIFSQSYITKLWIKEKLQERWQKNHAIAARSPQALRLKARTQKAEAEGDAAKTTVIAREKRKWTRDLFNECVQEELLELQDALRKEVDVPLCELEALHELRDGQQYIMLHDRYTALELVDSAEQRHQRVRRRLQDEGTFIDGQLEALDSLLQVGLRATAALDTRLNRLSAKDVRDPVEREAVKERRLGQPEALIYLSKASEELQFIRDYSKTVVAGFEHVEREMSNMAKDVGDWYVANKDALVYMAAQEALGQGRSRR